MANKWQLNASKQIVYFDANGNKRFAKEVWYIGQYNKYQVWPGSIYLTDVKIVDPNGREYDYTIDNNGNPFYTFGSDTFNGLCPNRKYSIKGTIEIYQEKNGENVKVASYENCYCWHLTHGDSNGDASVWTQMNGSEKKMNPITNDEWPYGVYECSENYSEDDNNVWIAPHMAVVTKWGSGNGVTEIKKLGEITDYGIRLKRIPITRDFDCDWGSNRILGLNEEITIPCTYLTSWQGLYPETLITNTGFTIDNDNSDIITVSHSNGQLTVKCVGVASGSYDFTLNATAYGKTDSRTYMVHVLGPSYRLFSNVTGAIGPNGNKTIKSDQIVTVYKATTYNDLLNANYTPLDNFTLSSSNSGVVKISNQTLKPVSSGFAIITVTDLDSNTSFTFNCVVETETYVQVIVDGVPSGSASKIDLNNSPKIRVSNQATTLAVGFYPSASATTSKKVYYKLTSGNANTTMSTQGPSPISIYIGNTGAIEWKYDIYSDSNYTNKIGSFTLDYL